MIAFRDVALRRGSRLLLSGVDVVLHQGWKVGVVGRNGSGKSSLFAAIDGELEPDSGSVDKPAGLRIASVAQETPALPEPALDYVLGGDAELAAALASEARATAAGDHAAVATAHLQLDAMRGYDGRARAGRLLHGLGFRPDQHAQPVAAFSGGWRGRLNLARALMAPSDLLLLDEPTNHLDLDAVVWLEQWLRHYSRTLMVIAHDREFLDHTVDHVLHLEQGSATLYVGSYSDFERQRAEQLHQQQAAHDREQVERAHLESFVNRFRAKATKARQAQSRLKRLEKLAGTEAVRAERAFAFRFPRPERVPESMLKLDHVDAGYEARDSGLGTRDLQPATRAVTQHAVLRDVRFGVQAGDRIGLLGPNGAGKSTLVKTLVGALEPLAGQRHAHKDTAIGYFAQHTVENLRAGETPFGHLRTLAPDSPPQALRDWLGQWHFAGDRAFEPVGNFSGGERARLALALIAWCKPNVLVLDEPTNHLDLDMRGALADALNDYPGALVLVAHDRHLLGLVCDRFWHVVDGHVQPFEGDLDDYAHGLQRRGDAVAVPDRRSPQPTRTSRERRREAAAERERQRDLRKRVQQIETRITAIEAALTGLGARLAEPAIYQGPTAVLADIGREQAALREEKVALEAAWLEGCEELEAATA